MSHQERMGEVSLFDVENETTMPNVRDMTIDKVSAADVREFAKRYHYTGHSGADLWRWGLWHGAILMGVVSYNNGTKTSTAAVFGEEHKDKIWHMGRLALAEDAPHNSESRLIGGSLQAISSTRPDVWAVITFAAQDQGHVGYVYQATNALYTGEGGEPVSYTDSGGEMRTHRPGKGTISRDDAEAKGWTRHVGLPKHRYVYILGNKTQRKHRLKLLKFPVLPYPKATL